MKGEILENAAVIMPGAFLFNERIIIGPGTIVEPGALIRGPVIIGSHSEIRQGAYIRGECVVGSRCVVGHTTEMKGSILLDGAKAAHFAYVGDSILGRDVNLGAGTKLANLKMVSGSITVRMDQQGCDTGRRKLGAILGDHTETGCNSVTSPGTLMGPFSIVYPGISVPGGYYPAGTVIAPAHGSLKIRRLKQ
jgi:NDP-sugar pyrophosphorylase family protein